MELIYKKIEEKDKKQLFKLIDIVLGGLQDQAYFIPYEQWELDSMFDEVNYAPLYGAYDGEKLVASIAPVRNDVRAAVTIISDDGFYNTAINLNELALKYDIKLTIAGVVSIVEPNLSGWKEIINDGHIELISHSYDHIKMEEGTEISNDKEALLHEIVDADKWFEDTFGSEQVCFVCPENKMCELGYEVLAENGFWAVRKGARGYNKLSPSDGTDDFDWYSLGVQGIADVPSAESRNYRVDYAISSRSWLIEMWHDVDDEDNGHYQRITKAEADEHLSYIKLQEDSKNIWVASYGDAVKYFREKENALVQASYNDNVISVSLEFDESVLPHAIFDYPLTVKIYIPKNDVRFLNKSYEFNGEILEMFFDDNGERYIMINIEPNLGIQTITVN